MNSTDLYAMAQKEIAKINIFRLPALTQPVSVFGISAVRLGKQYLNQWCFHKHQFDELNFILSGEATYCFENGKQVTVSEDGWILIPTGQSHRILDAAQNALKFSVLFTYPEDSPHLNGSFASITAGSPFFTGTVSDSLMGNMSFIFQNVIHKDIFHRMAIWSNVVSMIFGITGEIHPRNVPEGADQRSPFPDDQRYLAAVQYIRDNCYRPVRVPEVATHCNLSQKQLNRLFRDQCQCSVIQYIQQQRLAAAQKELLANNRPLYLISNELGFCDEFYFSHFFTKMMKISPTQYREIHHVQ